MNKKIEKIDIKERYTLTFQGSCKTIKQTSVPLFSLPEEDGLIKTEQKNTLKVWTEKIIRDRSCFLNSETLDFVFFVLKTSYEKISEECSVELSHLQNPETLSHEDVSKIKQYLQGLL